MAGRFLKGLRLGAVAMLGLIAGQASGQVVISQVYGTPTQGNGGSTYAYDVDFVELFNRGETAVDMSGWSVQLQWLGDWEVIPLSTTLQPGQYYLIKVYEKLPTTTNHGQPLPTPDLEALDHDLISINTDSTWIVAGDGTVALMNHTTRLASDTCPDTDPNMLDMVGWGAPFTPCNQGGAAPSAGNFVAILRKNRGCQDTNVNSADFEAGLPTPRNTSMTFPFYTTVNAAGSPPLGTTKLTAKIAPFTCNGTATLVSATVDLTPVGGGGSVTLLDNGTGGDLVSGDGTFSINYTLPGSVAVGVYPLTFTLTDALANQRMVNADLIVAIEGDICVFPKNVTTFPSSDAVSFLNFTDDTITSPCRSNNTGTVQRMGIWYKFTPASSQVVKVTKTATAPSLYNLALFTGTCGAMTAVDCDDSNDFANFAMTGGTTYYMLASYDNTVPNVPTAGTAAVTFNFSLITPPAEDACSGAIDLNSSGLAIGTPVTDSRSGVFANATAEPTHACNQAQEFVLRRGIWYRYTPASDVSFKTSESISGTNVNSACFSGSCASPTYVGCSPNEDGVYFMTAGTTYFILMGIDSTASSYGSSQTYNNTFTVVTPTANDLCTGAVDLGSLASPASVSVTAAAFAACSADTTSCGTNQRGLWYRFTAPDHGSLRLHETGSTSVSYSVYTGCPATGTAFACPSGEQYQYVDVVNGTTYYILVSSNSSTLPTAALALNFEFIPIQPNDTCSGAVDLNVQSFPFVTVVDPRASQNHDMDIGPCTTATQTFFGLWYKYTAPGNGLFTVVDSNTVTVNSQTQNADIGVWEVGSASDPCNSIGTQIGCIANSNDAGAFPVESGKTYLVLVGTGTPSSSIGSRPPSTYDLTFNFVQPLANDNCTGATNLTGNLPFHEVVDSFIAQDEDDVSCNPATAPKLRNGVWYTYSVPATTPPSTQTISFWDGNQRSMNVTLYTACGGSEIDCQTNDVTFTLNSGQQYYFLVGLNLVDPSSANGVYDVNFALSQPLTHDLCANAYEVTSFPLQKIVDMTAATADGPSPITASLCSNVTFSQTIWYKFHTMTGGDLTGGIEPDLGRAETGAAALFRANAPGTCADIITPPVWCNTDPSSPVSTPIVVNAIGLLPDTTYYLMIGHVGSQPASPADTLFSIDVSYSGLVAGSGTCCRGTTCNTSVAQASCTSPGAGIGAVFATGPLGSNCNALNNSIAPCCHADFNKTAGVTVQDIFDFLAAWFAGSPYARFAGDGTGGAPTAQSIFDFLAAWFSGQCPPYGP